MSAWGKWAWTAGALMLAGAAQAQTSRRVAMCPWTFGPGLEGSEATVQAVAQAEARKTLDLAPMAQVEKILDGKPCAAATEVLAPVAAQSRSAYAFFAHVEVARGKLVVSWRLTNDAGRTVAPHPASRALEVPLKGRTPAATAQAALPAFFADVVAPKAVARELGTEPVEPAAPDVTPPVAPRPPPVAVTHVEAPTETSPAPAHLEPQAPSPAAPAREPLPALRVAGWIVAGLGVAAEATALGVDLSTGTERLDLSARLDAQGRLTAGDTRGFELHQQLVNKGEIITGLLIGGGAAIVVGGAMLAVSYAAHGPGGTAVSLTVAPAGLGALVQGKF